MPDLAMTVTVSRDQLGLEELDVNDHVRYYVAPQFLGGQVQWNRNQVGSPFLDGQVTVFRNRQQVTEQIGVEVLGETALELQTNVNELVSAFIQDTFDMHVTMGTAGYGYRCEAADYQLLWSGPRFLAFQAQVVFSVPRQPFALLGVV